MKLLLKLILVIGILSVVNLLTLDQAARDRTLCELGNPPVRHPLSKRYSNKSASNATELTAQATRLWVEIFNAPDFTDSGWWAQHSDNAERVQVSQKATRICRAFGKKLTRVTDSWSRHIRGAFLSTRKNTTRFV